MGRVSINYTRPDGEEYIIYQDVADNIKFNYNNLTSNKTYDIGSVRRENITLKDPSEMEGFNITQYLESVNDTSEEGGNETTFFSNFHNHKPELNVLEIPHIGFKS